MATRGHESRVTYRRQACFPAAMNNGGGIWLSGCCRWKKSAGRRNKFLATFHNSFDLMLFNTRHTVMPESFILFPKQIVGNPLRSPSSCLTHRLRIMVSISGVIFILASLDGRLDLSDNSDLPCSFSQFIQRYNVERVIPHRKAVFVTEPVSTYSSSHFWRIRISSFMLRRYGLRFANEKKKCSVSIDT